MAGLRSSLVRMVGEHNRRMTNDPVYRERVERWKHWHEAQKLEREARADEPKHYDRDGYCDNPGRGY